MNEPLFDQLSARERRIIRKSLDPDVRLFYRSPQSSPRNHFRISKDISEQNTLQKTQNEEEKESKNKSENDLKSENNENESKSENNEIENNEIESNKENSEQTEEKNAEEEELNEKKLNNEQSNEQTIQNNEISLKTQSINNDEDEDILTRKLNEMSIKHSIQQKILIHEAEIDLKKSNYSPVSLRSFIIKTSNIKQRQQNEKMRIIEKYGSTYKVNRQLTQRSLRSKSERNVGNQNKTRSSHVLNLTPRLAMFALDKRTSSPNPRFSAPATLAREQEQLDITERIKLPSISHSQQITSIPLFDTESEKVYHSEKVFRLNDPFSNFLSSQELVSSPSIKLNVKPPPPPAKNAASPRKSGKKTDRSSKMSRKKGKSSMSTVTQETQEPQEPPPPPIKKHVLTMRASMIPKSGIIDVDKRDFLEFLNDKEEEIPVEVVIEENNEDDDKSSTKSSKSKNKKSRASSKMKSRASTKSKASSKK